MSTSPTENTEASTDLLLCNCDGAWHIECPDGITRYVGNINEVTDQAVQAFGEKVLKELPNSQNGKSRVFTADLHGSAMGEGYKLGISDVVSVITSLMEGDVK